MLSSLSNPYAKTHLEYRTLHFHRFIIAYFYSLCGSAHIWIIFAHISAKKIFLGGLTTDFSDFFAKSLDKFAVL